MHTRHAVSALLLALALVAGLAAAVLATPENFTAPLDGDQEVPAVDTDATGVAKFQLRDDGLHFRLNVANIEDVTMAHIHLAERGQNGGVVVWLYPDSPPPELIEGRFQGTLAEGVITADDLVGQLEGEPLSKLMDMIRAGNAYVNVHTEAHPGGEIRGQIDVPRGR